MRLLLLCAAVFAAGLGLGVISTWWELAGDRGPDLPRLPGQTASPAGAAGRAVVVGGETFDFGVMERGATRSHMFVIRNEGQAPLKVEKGETTCKCTLSELARGELAPGETTEVKLEWTPKDIDDEFSQTATLKTNDPERSLIRLRIYGRVRQLVWAEPGEIGLGQLSANEEAAGRVRIYSMLAEPLEIVRHEWRPKDAAEHFAARIRPLEPAEAAAVRDARSGVELDVTVKSGLPLGPLAQTIRLFTNHPDRPPLDIPLLGKVISDVTLAGPKLNPELNLLSLGVLERGAETRLTAFVLVKGPYRDATQVTVAGVSPAASLQAELGERLTDNPRVVRFPLTLIIPANAEPTTRLGGPTGDLGEVKLRTTHPMVPELVLRVRFAVRE